MNTLNFLKSIAPSPLHVIARKTRRLLFQYTDKKKCYLNKIKYEGYDLYYTKGAGLIERIRFGSTDRIYEAALLNTISQELNNALVQTNQPIFLDIGTNIGLISTAVLRRVPKAIIFGFEPSPVAYKSFFITIFANQLEKKIKLSNFALGNKIEVVKFVIHEEKDSSGDGLRETGRAEKDGTEIDINVITLDSWWKSAGSPKLNVIKIDIEGAELWALQGGEECIQKTRPTIFLEISLENLKAYPHTAMDVLAFFEKIHYQLKTIEGDICTQSNLPETLKQTDTFMAKPK